MAPRDQRSERVTEGHGHDGEGGEQLALRLRADEQRHADEADHKADQPEADGPSPRERTREGENSALKIGTAPWMIEARPESMRVSPQLRSQNGTAVFTIPTTTSQPHLARISSSVRRGPRPYEGDHGQEQRGRCDPAEDQGRRGQLPIGDLDQHERRAPDEREQREDDGRATHLPSEAQRSPVPADPSRTRH